MRAAFLAAAGFGLALDLTFCWAGAKQKKSSGTTTGAAEGAMAGLLGGPNPAIGRTGAALAGGMSRSGQQSQCSSSHSTIISASTQATQPLPLPAHAGRRRLTAAIRQHHKLPHASKLLSSLPFRAPKSGPSRAGKGGLLEPHLEVPLAYALLDSGATHPMRQAKGLAVCNPLCPWEPSLSSWGIV